MCENEVEELEAMYANNIITVQIPTELVAEEKQEYENEK